jgi:hypothetical protein
MVKNISNSGAFDGEGDARVVAGMTDLNVGGN